MYAYLQRGDGMRARSQRRQAAAQASLRVLVLAMSAFASPAMGASGDTAPDACSLKPGPTRTVTRIIDGETVALDDGKKVRLIGALAPRARDAGGDEGAWPLEEAAKTSLAELTLGKRVELAFGVHREDRYGRHLAHLFTNEGGERLWVQGELLQLGLARAYALPGDDTCLAELIANEQIARTAGAGVWTSHVYAPRSSAKTGELMAQRSTFQIVSGRVASVGRSKGTVYLDFGEDWHTDFTVSIPRRVAGSDTGLSAKLDGLKGRPVEVRGWIERRSGPLIAVTSAAQITIIADEPAAASAPEDLPPADPQTGTVSAPTPKAAPELARPRKTRPYKQHRPRRKAPGDVDL